MSFEATILCLAPERLFIAARVKAMADFVRADLEQATHFYQLWLQNLETMQRKRFKCSENLSGKIPCEEHKIFGCFISRNVRKFQLQIVSVQVVPPQLEQIRTWAKFVISPKKIDNLPLNTSSLK
jgi:hypothetical protein